MQSSGVAGFSYGDLAKRLGVKAPSIHHHVGRKDELVAAATREYRREFRERVEAMPETAVLDRLRSYVAMFVAPAGDGLLCLCGAVATDWPDVGADGRAEVDAFLAAELAWLTNEVARGVGAGELRCDLAPDAFAMSLIAALEGALVLERTPAGAGAADSVSTLLALAVAAG